MKSPSPAPSPELGSEFPPAVSESVQFYKFMTVGALGFIVDAFVLYILTRFAGLDLLVAQALSFSAAVIHNFFWNRHWTFPHARGKSLRRQLVQFYVTNAVGIVIRTGIIAFVMEPYARLAVNPIIPSAFHKFVADYAALSTAVLVVSLWNYTVSRIWTFRDPVPTND